MIFRSVVYGLSVDGHYACMTRGSPAMKVRLARVWPVILVPTKHARNKVVVFHTLVTFHFYMPIYLFRLICAVAKLTRQQHLSFSIQLHIVAQIVSAKSNKMK